MSSNSMSAAVLSGHRVISETPTAMVKASLRKAEKRDWPSEVGSALRRARLFLGWSLKEFACELERATEKKRDERQLARWEDGKETPQMAALFAIDKLRGPLVIQLANLAHEIEVVTEIRVRG
jgi:ribosome-binding protein aMBF1 (putative translation factor)